MKAIRHIRLSTDTGSIELPEKLQILELSWVNAELVLCVLVYANDETAQRKVYFCKERDLVEAGQQYVGSFLLLTSPDGTHDITHVFIEGYQRDLTP